MAVKILLITPPFTQPNTPYPATPCLKGFLRAQGHAVFQADLGIELINKIFSPAGLAELFASIRHIGVKLSPNSRHILKQADRYLRTIGPVMNFLQYRDNTLAQLVCAETFLPRAARFDSMPEMEWSFGNMGVTDKARFLATLYVEDIGDLVREAVTPHFGFSRYAEKLGVSARSFTPLAHALAKPENLIETWLLELLAGHLRRHRPDVVGVTIPFPGNLYAGLRCGGYIKKRFPKIKVVLGGGFVNTELRALTDPAVFDYTDFITLDDGERPFLNILRRLRRGRGKVALTRTFVRLNGAVRYVNDDPTPDFTHAETGCPDYSDLALDKYLSLIELANPMHRLWNDGGWNKLALAHGCYWRQCAFCDTTLDYIKRFDGAPASVLVDRIERIVAQTGRRGFHFVDEAAPPATLHAVARELLRRRMVIAWWANIRFEKAFDAGLCRLLADAGCIAVAGGLEAASDRLLKLMRKGVTVRQAACVCDNFARAGIMVHAYLMYGVPTQTPRETVDALETVRQFFKAGLIQSAFWHLFTATAHSDVGRHPAKYHCRIARQPAGGFADNDLAHADDGGCAHADFTAGLNKAVYNYMHGIALDLPVTDWFDFPVPAPSVKRNHVRQALR